MVEDIGVLSVSVEQLSQLLRVLALDDHSTEQLGQLFYSGVSNLRAAR